MLETYFGHINFFNTLQADTVLIFKQITKFLIKPAEVPYRQMIKIETGLFSFPSLETHFQRLPAQLENSPLDCQIVIANAN